MGLPVLLSVLSEDRDDLELLKGALEVLQLSVALPDGMQQQEQAEVSWTDNKGVPVGEAPAAPRPSVGLFAKALQRKLLGHCATNADAHHSQLH
jgi:hypothetical protein